MERKKSLLEIFLTPLIVAITGLIGTYFITNRQIESTQIFSESQIKSSENQAKSAQQIKLLEIFSEKITSANIKDREIAVRILNTFDQDLSRKLALAVIENSKEDTSIKNIAVEFLEEKSYVVLSSYKILESAKIDSAKFCAQRIPYPINIYKTNGNVFAVCIGGPLSRSDAKRIIQWLTGNTKIKDVYIQTGKWQSSFASN